MLVCCYSHIIFSKENNGYVFFIIFQIHLRLLDLCKLVNDTKGTKNPETDFVFIKIVISEAVQWK